jgi:ribosomal protein S18 acetylase RimI-like enzyme
VIGYRTFLNNDPPALVDVWNRSFTGRGAVFLTGPLLLDYFVLSKPYFDPAGLILAHDEGRVLGFALAGFAPNAEQTALDLKRGILCVLGVVPEARKQGIGTELLHRAEAYLRGRGAEEILAGPLGWLSPFTFGLYGGGQSPGFLESDALARPFLEKHGYKVQQTSLVYQRSLSVPLNVADPRFTGFRQECEIHAGPMHGSWWQECVFGPLEVQEFRLVEKHGTVLARCSMWEMEPYAQRWNEQPVGMVQFEVAPEHRRHGAARFFLVQLMRHLRDQFFTVIETQLGPDNAAGLALLNSLGFEHIDTGHLYRLERS